MPSTLRFRQYGFRSTRIYAVGHRHSTGTRALHTCTHAQHTHSVRMLFMSKHSATHHSTVHVCRW
eukprot:11423790-Alexandrium_andersonii.AAC.1